MTSHAHDVNAEPEILEQTEPEWRLHHRGIAVKLANRLVGAKFDDGPVSKLHEWVQAQSKQGTQLKILHWNFEQQMENKITLQFKATVSFVVNGVPHHIEGDWQTSKKKAQKDCAERALYYFEQLDPISITYSSCPVSALSALNPPAQFTSESDGINYRSTVKILLAGVPHHFRGAWKSTEEESHRDVASRTLGYLHVPTYSEEYMAPEFDRQQEPTFDMKGFTMTDGEDAKLAQQKTIIMQVQNLLQKVYSKEMKPGQETWEWVNEIDAQKNYRATVNIPVSGKSFVGNWCTGRKEAQRDACEKLKEFLEEQLAVVEQRRSEELDDSKQTQSRWSYWSRPSETRAC